MLIIHRTRDFPVNETNALRKRSVLTGSSVLYIFALICEREMSRAIWTHDL